MKTDWVAGEVCGPYELMAPLGQGGAGEVWKALDSRLGRLVALKFLASHHHRDMVTRGRFALESRAASSLNHPNILTVYEAGELGGIPYIASELVEGRDLTELLGRGQSLETSLCLDIAVQVLEGLESVHSLGIIHRDIKPQNIRLRDDGIVKILDFGVAKKLDEPGVSLPGRVVGTPRYMAPEQIKDQPLDAVVQRALNKDPEERFASAAEMRRALLGVQGGATLEDQTQDLSWRQGTARVMVKPVEGLPELAGLAGGVTREFQNRLSRLGER